MAVPSEAEKQKVQKKLEGFLKKLNPDGSPKRPMDDNLAKGLMRDAVRKKWMYWTIVSETIHKDSHGSHYLLCKCVCGIEKLVFKQDLVRGKSNSCEDCARVSDPEKFISIKNKHELVGRLQELPPYVIWRKMQQRCDNPKDAGYENYGGRGITLSVEFRDYLDFIDWSYSNGYSSGLTIERIDVNGDYSPDNCKWIPLGEQARNKRKYRSNKSGITGVRLSSNSWVCYWYNVNREMKTKSFSITKYGFEEAKIKATEYRKEQITLLEESGVFYGEFHGL